MGTVGNRTFVGDGNGMFLDGKPGGGESAWGKGFEVSAGKVEGAFFSCSCGRNGDGFGRIENGGFSEQDCTCGVCTFGGIGEVGFGLA